MKVVVLLCCGERKVKEEKCLFTSSGRGFILAGLKNLIDKIDSSSYKCRELMRQSVDGCD